MGVLVTGIIMFTLYPIIILILKLIIFTGEGQQNEKA